MPQSRSAVVRWTTLEKAQIIEQAGKIKLDAPGMTDLDLIRHAIKVLPPERQRHIPTLSNESYDWFRDTLGAAVDEAQAERKAAEAAEAKERAKHDAEVERQRAEAARQAQEDRDRLARERRGEIAPEPPHESASPSTDRHRAPAPPPGDPLGWSAPPARPAIKPAPAPPIIDIPPERLFERYPSPEPPAARPPAPAITIAAGDMTGALVALIGRFGDLIDSASGLMRGGVSITLNIAPLAARPATPQAAPQPAPQPSRPPQGPPPANGATRKARVVVLSLDSGHAKHGLSEGCKGRFAQLECWDTPKKSPTAAMFNAFDIVVCTKHTPITFIQELKAVLPDKTRVLQGNVPAIVASLNQIAEIEVSR